MAQGDIIQNIVLAGQSDVIAGLSSIGEAGVQAFTALSSAASNINLSSPLGAITGFTAAIATATAGFFGWAEASTNATIRTANFGDEMGTSAQQMTTLITALAQGGNQVADLTTSFRRLAVSVEAEWPTIQKAVRNASNQMQEDYIKLGEANVELTFQSGKAAEKQEQDQLDIAKAHLDVATAKENLVKTDNDSTLQMQANATDILSAEGQLSAALFALDHARKPATKSEKAAQTEQQASIAAAQAQLAIQRAIQKQQEEATESALKHRQAVLAIREAQERLRESQRKAAEDQALAPLRAQQAALAVSKAQAEEREHQANDIQNLKKYVDNLASGASNADSKVQLSSANLIKGLIASIGPGVQAVDGFKGSLGDLGLAAPKLYDVMLKVADIFHHTTDETLRASLATALFGRGYSFTLVEALSQGSEAIKAAQERIAATFDLTKQRVDEQVRVARDFRGALNSLAEGIGLVSKQINTIIAPIFTAILQQIESAVEANRTKFLEWAQAIRDNLTPAITGFVSSLAGINLSNAFNLSPEQILKAAEWKQSVDTIKDFVITGFNAVKDFLTSTLPTAFQAVMAGFNAIADVINFFGGNVTGTQVAVAALIGQLSGLNNALLAVGIALGGIAIALAANPFGLAVIAITGLIVALGYLAYKIYQNKDAINDWLNTKIQGAFNWIGDAFDDVATGIKRSLEDIRKDIADTLTFKGVATRAAERQDIEKKRAQEDVDTARARATRDQGPIDESAGLNLSKTILDKEPLTLEDAWKSLGTVVDKTLSDGKKGLDAFGDSARNVNRDAQQAIQSAAQAAGLTPEQLRAQRLQQAAQQKAQQESQEEDPLKKLREHATNQFSGLVRGVGGGGLHPGVTDEQFAAHQAEAAKQQADAEAVRQRVIQQAITQAQLESQGTGGPTQQVPQPQVAQVPTPDVGPQQTAKEQIAEVWRGLIQDFADIFQDILQDAESFAQKLADAINSAKQAAKGSSSSSGSASANDNSSSNDSGTEEEVQHFASGGQVGGKPGIDTNLIAATRGEFIHNTDAVQHYGVSFMQALNSKRIPKFALGGMIGAVSNIGAGMIPAYASGGLVSFEGNGNGNSGGTQMAQVHFHAPDGRTIGKGIGDRDLVEGLQRFSTAGSRYSTGKAQSWRT